MILWFSLGPWSVDTVGWVGVGLGDLGGLSSYNDSMALFRAKSVDTLGWVGFEFGILAAFSNRNDFIVLFRGRFVGHGVLGWIWGSWRSVPTFVIQWFCLGPSQWMG